VSDGSYFQQMPVVKIHGTALGEENQNHLLDIRIDQGLNVVSSATLHFARSVSDLGSTVAKLGAELEISEPKGGAVIFKGDITGVEVERATGEVVTTLTALDALHQLTGHSRVLARKKVKVSDVLGDIAGYAGLTKDIDSTAVSYDYLFQTGTDFDYLAELAERAGLDWWCHNGKLYAKVVKLGAPKLKMTADELLRLSIRASGKRPQKVTVSGWDVKTSQAITGDATLTKDALGAATSLADQVVGYRPRLSQEQRTSTIPIAMPEEAKVVAGAALNRAASGAIRAEFEGYAMWTVLPGDTVEVHRSGDFDGKYIVSAVEHRVSAGEVSTRLIAGTRHPTGLAGSAGGAPLHGRTPGIVTAKVTNIDDPENLGRVKVKFMGIDESQESEWARVLLMNAGPQTGATTLPEVNDEVLVTFENNDVRRPIVLGSLFTSETTLPMLKREGGKFTHVTLMERFGHQILMWGTGSEQGITIKLKNAGEITMDHEGTRLVGVQGKKTTITQGQSKIEMTDQGDITIDGNNVTINAKSKIAFESKGQASLKGATVAVQSQGTVDVKGTKTSVNGDAMLTLKGGIVQIN
jgi:uncharacterized protein involved in type VI secretion and phage assembly